MQDLLNLNILTLPSSFEDLFLARVQEANEGVDFDDRVVIRNDPAMVARPHPHAFLAKKIYLKGRTINPGGIDLNSDRMLMRLRGQGMDWQIDRAMMERIKAQGFDGLEFKFKSIVPLTNLPFLLGLEGKEEEHLVLN